ncbi:MAG: L,D-transpeptidase family protein [Candidatus Anammoxibacter sp.]
MRNIVVLICLFYITTWQFFPASSFAENPKDSDNVIYVDEIVVDTEDIENKNGNVDDEEVKAELILEESSVIFESGTVEEDAELVGEVFDDALKYIEEGKIYEARKILSSSFFTETSESIRSKIKEKLDGINKKLVFSPSPSPDSFVYTVKGGDTLSKIADEFNTTYELIMMINNKYRTNIRVGERLKIIKGPFSLLIDKNDFELTVMLNDHYIKQYKIGTGKDGKTPVGAFEIAEKIKNPVWYSGDGVYAFGHPGNILGTRWIGFKDKPGLYGYGIHGTKIPESIGKAESNGCIRLLNENVEEVFAFVTNDTKVTIQD